MNKALLWLAQQHNMQIQHADEQCYLCGTSCTSSHLVEKTIADTFNSHFLAQCPLSRQEG